VGALGLPGLTAYYALHEIVKVTKDDSIVISGAAGAVGTMAVQIAKKLIGCKHVD
jgi:NADPH-dependent curcumin reductase CurA